VRQIKLSEFTLKRIKNREFEKFIPEFYELEEIVENDDWHNNDSVLNHTLTVLEKLEELLKNIRGKIAKYLNREITNYTRKDLLFLAAVFHDIGKKEMFAKENNKTSCQNHEKESARKANKILSRLDLSKKEKDLIRQIIKYHNVIPPIVEPNNNKLNEEFAGIQKNYSNIFLEILLLSMADLLGNQLRENNPAEFNFKINFYKKALHYYE